jgi:AcrR family transcriptional regulator
MPACRATLAVRRELRADGVCDAKLARRNRSVTLAPRRAPPRRRRTAEEARRAILEAAQKRLAECGPEEIRLQDIASDLGISHPAILHHFGSRETLLLELSRHALRSLNADLVRVLADSSQEDVKGWLDRVFETLRDRGHARLLAWSLLTGRLGRADGASEGEADDRLLFELAEAVHARRGELARRVGAAEPSLEDSVFAVQLVAAALLGDALMGPLLRRSAGLATDDGSNERFRLWLGRQVMELLIPSHPGSRREPLRAAAGQSER